MGERHVGSVSKCSLLLLESSVLIEQLIVLLFNNSTKLLKEPGVQEEKTAERIVQERGV